MRTVCQGEVMTDNSCARFEPVGAERFVTDDSMVMLEPFVRYGL